MPVSKPVFRHQYTARDKKTGEAVPFHKGMVATGPVVPIEIRQPAHLEASLKNSGLAIPDPVKGMGLVDTGASLSAVDAKTVKRLFVQPVGAVRVSTAGGVQQQSVYPLSFVFAGSNIVPLELRLIGADLDQVLPHADGDLVALIGRDILNATVLTYNGPEASFSLEFVGVERQ